MNSIILKNLICILTLIPVEYTNDIHLYKYIRPSNDVRWWKAGVVDLFSGYSKIYFCSDSNFKLNLSKPVPGNNTYVSNYKNSLVMVNYLMYLTSSSELKYITKVEDLKLFLGRIDNLPEALLLASLYGYKALPGMDYGSYYIVNNSYIINLSKVIYPPDVMPPTVVDESGSIVSEKPVKAQVKIDLNADIYELKSDSVITCKKLELKDMYRTLLR